MLSQVSPLIPIYLCKWPFWWCAFARPKPLIYSCWLGVVSWLALLNLLAHQPVCRGLAELRQLSTASPASVASAHATDALRLLVDYFTSLRLRLFSCVRVLRVLASESALLEAMVHNETWPLHC